MNFPEIDYNRSYNLKEYKDSIENLELLGIEGLLNIHNYFKFLMRL